MNQIIQLFMGLYALVSSILSAIVSNLEIFITTLLAFLYLQQYRLDKQNQQLKEPILSIREWEHGQSSAGQHEDFIDIELSNYGHLPATNLGLVLQIEHDGNDDVEIVTDHFSPFEKIDGGKIKSDSSIQRFEEGVEYRASINAFFKKGERYEKHNVPSAVTELRNQDAERIWYNIYLRYSSKLSGDNFEKINPYLEVAELNEDEMTWIDLSNSRAKVGSKDITDLSRENNLHASMLQKVKTGLTNYSIFS